MPAVLDTNVLIYDTMEDTSLSAEARRRLDGLDKWYIPAIVMHEFVWFMGGQAVNLSFTRHKVIEYTTHEKAEVVPDDADGILFSVERTKSYHDYNDHIILAAATRVRAPLLTFDRKLREVASRLGVKVL